MHPIEHLRHVARARHIDAVDLVRESAVALGSLRADGPDLVIACRRIVERHPEIGPLWWMSARMLTSDDATTMAWQVADEIECSTTAEVLAHELPDGATVVTIGRPAIVERALIRRGDVRVWCADAGYTASGLMQRLERADVDCEPVPIEALAHAVGLADLVLIEPTAVSTRRVLAPAGSLVVAAVAQQAGTPVWCVAGLGTCLPTEYVDEIAGRVLPGKRWQPHVEIEVDDVPRALLGRVVTSRGVSDDVPAALRPECALAPELLRSSRI